MNPFQRNPAAGFFAMTLLGVAIAAVWLGVSDPQLAQSVAGSRSAADWAMLVVLLVGVLVLIGVGATIWIAGAQLISSLVKLLAIVVVGVALWLVLAAPADPGAPSASIADRLHAWVEFWTLREGSPAPASASLPNAAGAVPVAPPTATATTVVTPAATATAPLTSPLTTTGAAPVTSQPWW